MNYRKYIFVILIMNSIWFIFTSMNYFYLKNNGETLTVEQVVTLQKSNQFLLYGTGVHNNMDAYKLELFKQRKPSIITFGQSRVMQFREYFFSKPFVNMGVIFQHLILAKDVAEAAIDYHKPDVVLMSFDYWMFDTTPENVGLKKEFHIKNNTIDFAGLIKPWIWIKEKKISIHEYFNVLFGLHNKSQDIGVTARYHHTGFGNDGSYYYSGLVSGNESHYDWRFKKTLLSLERKEFYGQSSQHMDHEKFKYFLETLKVFHSNNVKIIIFIPPIAPTIYKKLNISFRKEIISELQKNNIQYVDLFDPTFLSSDDCEYIDAVHPGDLTYAKILLHLSAMPEYSYLKNYINGPLLHAITHTYQHIAFIPDERAGKFEEIDILGMGCQKVKQSPLAQLSSQKV